MKKFCLFKLALSYKSFNFSTSNLDWVQIWLGSEILTTSIFHTFGMYICRKLVRSGSRHTECSNVTQVYIYNICKCTTKVFLFHKYFDSVSKTLPQCVDQLTLINYRHIWYIRYIVSIYLSIDLTIYYLSIYMIWFLLCLQKAYNCFNKVFGKVIHFSLIFAIVQSITDSTRWKYFPRSITHNQGTMQNINWIWGRHR